MFKNRILAAALSALLLICGCAPEAPPPISAPAVSELSSETQEQVRQISEQALGQMKRLAKFYEISCFGTSRAEGEAIYHGEGVGISFLSTVGLIEKYRDERFDHWSVPTKDLSEIDRFFMDFPQKGDIGGHRNFAGSWSSLPFEMKERETEVLENGDILITFDRNRKDETLTPVTYLFSPHKADEVPDILAGFYSPGEVIYRIKSVTNRPDLLPEIKIRTIDISNAEELLQAAERINVGSYENRFDIYRLTADIDLAGIEWTPIGLNNRVLEYWNDYDTVRDPNIGGFNGVFDGQGHTISNLTITEPQSNTLLSRSEQNFPDRPLSGIGLFYRIGPHGVVKNLKLENASVELSSVLGEYGSCSGLLAAECSGIIENVSVQGSVKGVGEAGGIAGRLSGYDTDARISNCVADIKVSGHSSVGGLVGILHGGLIENCRVYGTVTAIPAGGFYQNEMPRFIGGMMGHSVGGRVDNSYASCYVLTSVPSGCVGGFSGLVEGGDIVRCTIDGKKLGGWEIIDDYHRTEPQIEIKK